MLDDNYYSYYGSYCVYKLLRNCYIYCLVLPIQLIYVWLGASDFILFHN